MASSSSTARLLAGIVSLLAWAGLALQFQATLTEQGNLAAALVVLTRFFTILTNLFVAIVFGAFALRRTQFATPSRLGCATLAIMLVGIVYAALLQGLHPLVGEARVADFVLHKITPIAVPLCWLVAIPRGGLIARDPWLWALYPLVYLGYALWRGAEERIFAYPFLNYPKNGWPFVFANAGVMAIGFLLVGFVMLWLDRTLGGRRALGLTPATRP